MKHVTCLALLLCLFAGFSAHAQEATTAPVVPFGQISGAEHPEQITDLVALRMWLNDAYPVTQANPQGAVNVPFIHAVGLSTVGETTLTQIVASYNVSLQTIVTKRHNQVDNEINAAVAAGTLIGVSSSSAQNQDTFWKNVYGLVSNTLLGLQVQLSASDYAQFMENLQTYRGGLQISPLDIGLGQMAEIARKEARMYAANSMPGMPMPQGENMTANYNASETTTITFPTKNLAPNPFTTGWAQDTATGNAGFTGSAPDVYPSGSGSGEANAYWPAGGTSKAGISTMTLFKPPTNGNSIGVRTNISNNGASFYVASLFYCASGCSATGSYINVYKYNNLAVTFMGQKLITSSQVFATNDQLTLQAINGNLIITYVSSNTPAYNTVLNLTDSSPLPAGYVGIQECPCGGFGAYANWTGGTGLTTTTSASITGDTTGSGWPPGTTHTPYVTTEFGPYGNSVRGGAVPPQDYVNNGNSVTYNPDVDGWDPSTSWTFTFLEGITCSQVGNFWQAGSGVGLPRLHPYLWEAVTYKYIYTPKPPLNALNNCTKLTTPPDFQPKNLFPANLTNWTGVNYAMYGTCTWIGHTACIPPVDFMVPDGPELPLRNCTSGGGTMYPVIVLVH